MIDVEAHQDVEALVEDAPCLKSLGKAWLGRSLYRHERFLANASNAPAWSHTELTYFRENIPHEVLRDLVHDWQFAHAVLLRAEILLTTPASFLLPPDWRGAAERPGWKASLEYIDVRTEHLAAYRKVMRDYCGPAAARLVASGRFGTFRALETAAVLQRHPRLHADWNQIHLCEMEPDGFSGFGPLFAAALTESGQYDQAAPDPFSGLDRMRSVSCWTFNEPLVEADAAILNIVP
jgi:hypothetical protein